MELSVKTLDSHTHNFKDLDEEITVTQFKEHISSTVGLPPEQQRLIFRGRVLQNEKKLKDYNVTSGQVIHLVSRNPTTTSSANDHPPQPINAGNSATGGRNNAIIMGTIGTLEFPNTSNLNSNRSMQSTPSRNPAAVRLTVANQTLTTASNLLRTLEEDTTLLHPQPQSSEAPSNQTTSTSTSRRQESESFMQGFMDAVGLHHAATTAAGVASSVQQSESVNAESTTPGETATTTNNSSTGTQPPPANNAPESPMIRELATSINDLLALNERLTPYLRTVQRWLIENGEFGDNRASAQYTFNSISSILHSVSHSIHAMSDITIDFSLPPGQRRLRSPLSVWVEQSPVIRATIPIGVHVGMDTNSTTTTGSGGVSGSNGGTTGEPELQVIAGQASLPATGGFQLQQAITNLIQGVMSGQNQVQRQPQHPLLSATTTTTQSTSTTTAGSNGLPPQLQPMMNQIGSMFGQQGLHITATTAPASITTRPRGISNVTSMSGAGTNVNSSVRSTPGVGTIPTQQQGTQHSHYSFLDPLQPQPPRLEHVILQCQSHHFAVNSTLPPMPNNIRTFLSQEVTRPIPEDAPVFDAFVSMLQGINVIHPLINQYIRGNILRGRDVNNPSHVTTGVRVYARRVVDWIVSSILSTHQIDSTQLTSTLNDVVTSFLSELTQVILTASPGSVITPTLSSMLNRWMPKLLTALESAFPNSEHLRVLKGIILLIVNYCFPEASLVFMTQLTTAISEYVINCQPTPPQAEVEHMTEVSMEIDVEIDDMFHIEISTGDVALRSSTNDESTTTEENILAEGEQRLSEYEDDGGTDSEDDIDEEYQEMASNLFMGLPQAWHSTLLQDIQRQAPLRDINFEGNRQQLSAGFVSLFPQK